MRDKRALLEQALAPITDGMTLMVGGFGLPGTPLTLLDGLLAKGVKGLTIIKNEANEAGMGVSRLIEAGRVTRLIITHLGLNGVVMQMMHRGEVRVEFHPQGILAEKIRCGGAGLLGFVTDIGIHTILRETRRVIDMDGREAFLEPALRADAALVHAARADAMGNLAYVKSARNFNPLMAMAADYVAAEAVRVDAPGALGPDDVHTPGAFVDAVVELGELSSEYKVLEHHVSKS